MISKEKRALEILFGTFFFFVAYYLLIHIEPVNEYKQQIRIFISFMFVLGGYAFYFPEKFEWGMKIVCFFIGTLFVILSFRGLLYETETDFEIYKFFEGISFSSPFLIYSVFNDNLKEKYKKYV